MFSSFFKIEIMSPLCIFLKMTALSLWIQKIQNQNKTKRFLPVSNSKQAKMHCINQCVVSVIFWNKKGTTKEIPVQILVSFFLVLRRSGWEDVSEDWLWMGWKLVGKNQGLRQQREPRGWCPLQAAWSREHIEAILLQLQEKLHLQALVLLGDFNHPDIYWKSIMVSCRQSKILLKCVVGKFLSINKFPRGTTAAWEGLGAAGR